MKMNINKKTTVVTAVIIILAGIGVWMFRGTSPKFKVAFSTARIEKGNISNTVTATGTVEPVTQVEVGTQVSGIIDKLYADYNSQVTKGQLIAELDKVNLLNELASKKSSMNSSKTEYEYQLKNYTRSKTLHEKGLVSDTDYELAVYNYEKALNAYDISQNEYAKAKTNLGYATIYSPIDGVVLSKAVEEGQTVNAGMSTPTLFTIANDLTDMQVVADVDEADIGGVREGQHVSFTVDAYPNDTFEGNVTQVRQEATVTSNVVTYEVVISASNPDLKLKPGLTANITIYTLEKNNVLTVPSKALRFKPEVPFIGPQDEVKDIDAPHKLWTRQGRTFQAHAIETGTSNGILTEIISGLPEGTVVITESTAGQMPGMAAAPDSEEKPSESSPFMPGPRGNKKKSK